MSTHRRAKAIKNGASRQDPREGPWGLAFAATSVPMWIEDEETRRVLAVNDAAVARYGYSRPQFLAMGEADLTPLDDPALKGSSGISRHRMANGATIDVKIKKTAFHVDGRPAFLVEATEAGDQELRKSERRYRQFFEAASDWFWETDTDNRLTYLSSNVEAVLGMPPETYYGKRLAETEGVIIDPAAGRTSLAAIKARQPYRDFIYSRKLPNDKVVWVNSSGAPFFGEDGTFLGYRGIARDVTAQVEGERKLRESEQRFRELFEIGADYYYEMDDNHRLTFASPESFHDELYGVPASQLYGKRVSEFPGVSFSPETGLKILLAIKAKVPYRDAIISIDHPGGKKRWISVCGAPIFDAHREFRGYRGVSVEITARLEAEAAARLAQRQLHDAVVHLSQPFAVFDAEGRAVAFNQAFADLYRMPNVNSPVHTGITFRELAEWQLRIGFYAEGATEQAIDLQMLLDGYQSDREDTCRLRDGRWMLVAYRRLPGDGKLALWTDITEIKRVEAERGALQEQLHHSQRLEALGTLAGGAAHEINNALVPVIALTKMMAGKLPAGSRERRNLDLVLTGAQRSRDLVKQILAFSRKEEARPQQSVDVGAVVREALALMRATAPTSIRLEEEIVPVAAISGDSGQLQQVIVNIVTNAAQAIGQAPGKITVRLRPEADGAHLCLSVADTGCGMDAATLARVFEPFFTTKLVGEGTGLGLSVAHGIIKAHGGRIEAASTPGEGSRFDIFLPVTPAQANQAA
jgi:two-component system, cell cycle sensor histidine kinase and response regulator CckA